MSLCVQCAHWDRLGYVNGRYGKCRAEPPRAALVRGEAGELDEDGRWPYTNADDWCGAFKKRPEEEKP